MTMESKVESEIDHPRIAQLSYSYFVKKIVFSARPQSLASNRLTLAPNLADYRISNMVITPLVKQWRKY